MSQENVEIVRRLYDEFLASPERVSDPDVLRFFDPGVEIRQSSWFLGTEETFHGYAGLARASREAFAVFRGLHWVPIRLIENGEYVVAIVKARAYGKQSDVKINETIAHVWTLREGRIVAWHVYMDATQALEAAGLRE